MSATSAAKIEPVVPSRRVLLSRWNRCWKRLIDIAGAGVILFLAVPFIAILALLIKWHDAGPVFYRRHVVGQSGEFDAFKLRTMRVDADELLLQDEALRRQFEVNFKLKDDPRVTRIGAALRGSGLDELPQLWNVFKGEMSLVGPRMITPAELKRYKDAAWIFSSVKPGITGYWQVQGDQEAGYERRVSMDLFYVENWSLWLDLKILFKTPWRVLRRSRGQ